MQPAAGASHFFLVICLPGLGDRRSHASTRSFAGTSRTYVFDLLRTLVTKCHNQPEKVICLLFQRVSWLRDRQTRRRHRRPRGRGRGKKEEDLKIISLFVSFCHLIISSGLSLSLMLNNVYHFSSCGRGGKKGEALKNLHFCFILPLNLMLNELYLFPRLWSSAARHAHTYTYSLELMRETVKREMETVFFLFFPFFLSPTKSWKRAN